MHSEVVIVARAHRLPRIECRGGLAARITETDTVHLVSAAATPLGGDTISIRVVVEPEARLRLRSVAAAVVLPAVGELTSHAALHLEVAGYLDVDLEPTIVAADARHLSTVDVQLDGSSALRLRERVQLGRSGEHQGFWSGALHADAAGLPLLRHRVELGADSVSHDVLSAPRACVSELWVPAGDSTAGENKNAGEAEATAEGAVALELAGGGVLTTWQGLRL
ncbi:MAG: urease accessory protein UreD [Mycobacterium sp.]